MNANAALEHESGRSILAVLGSVAVWALLAAATGIAVLVALTAALVIGLLVAGAAFAIQFAPRRKAARATGPEDLEARRTAQGWVVEVDTRR